MRSSHGYFWPAVMAGLLLTGVATAQPAPTGGVKGTVIKPPAHIDPGMQVKPKPGATLPMPVKRPPASVVPK